MEATATFDTEYIDADMHKNMYSPIVMQQIGPRVPGGRYFCCYWRQSYTVLAIEHASSGFWRMRVQWEDGAHTTHCTAWNSYTDLVIDQPIKGSVYLRAWSALFA